MLNNLFYYNTVHKLEKALIRMSRINQPFHNYKRRVGENMMKKAVAAIIAKTAEKMAKAAAGTASHFGSYQCKEPAKLSKSAK